MILAIESSTPHAGLCLREKEETVWSHEFTSDRSHNSHIFEPIAEALEFCGRKLDLISVGLGPGSYSGVRVGIAAANGISLALQIPVVGVSSLEAYSDSGGDFLVVGDARRKSFFIATIKSGQMQGEPELVDEERFPAALAEKRINAVFSMDEWVADRFQGVVHRFPTAENLAKRTVVVDSDSQAGAVSVEPHYLRPPYITQAKKKPVPGFPA